MPGQLNALRLDAPSLFSLFCSSKKRNNPDIFDFEDNVIMSRQIATENKDVVFSSFFDLSFLRGVSNSYGQQFGDLIVVLPGLKTVRLIGNSTTYLPLQSCRSVQHISVSPKKQVISSKQESTYRLKLLQAEIFAPGRQMKEGMKQRKEFLLMNKIGELKKQWVKCINGQELSKCQIDNNRNLYNLVQMEKQKKNDFNNKIRKSKRQLSKVRQEYYFLKRKHYEADNQKEEEEHSPAKLELTKNSYKCFEKVENIIMNE